MAKEKSEFIRLSAYDIGIIGGADTLPEAERGPLDTATDKAHPLYDERLKKVKMTPEWVSNIRANGVKAAIQVVYLDPDSGSNDSKGVPYVVDGRERVRAARLASKAEGADFLVYARVVQLSASGMVNDMIALNVRHDDSTSTKIAKAKRALVAGLELADVARAFSVKPATIGVWQAYDKTAIPALKKAVDTGAIPSSTGFDIARSGNAAVQEAALAKVLALQPRGKKADSEESEGEGGGEGVATRKGQSHAAKREIARAAGEVPGVNDKRTLKKLLALVKEHTLPKNATDIDRGWWGGFEDALCFFLGADTSKACDVIHAMVEEIDAGIAEGNSTPDQTDEDDELERKLAPKKGKKA